MDKETNAIYQKRYRKRHPDRIRESQRKWAAKNQKKRARYRKTFKKRHSAKISEYNRKYYAKTANAANNGERWSSEEIEAVLAHKETDTELSKKIGRSVMAIQVKRSKLMAGEMNSEHI